MANIVILGGTGMLGHVVAKHFSRNTSHNVSISYRTTKYVNKLHKDVPPWASTFHFDAIEPGCFSNLPNADYVINCIGCVKQRDYDIRTYIKINAQFPHLLAQACEKMDARLIHVTTDCVFSGKLGSYKESATPDADDLYGVSKELGEPDSVNAMTIRTSIIGPELRANYSLFEWARSQKGNTVNGFVNHWWNGITNLQYAKVCDRIITKNMFTPTTLHVFSEKKSKHDMLVKFNEEFNLNLNIVPTAHTDTIDRSLSTMYDFNERLEIPSFDAMVKELHTCDT